MDRKVAIFAAVLAAFALLAPGAQAGTPKKIGKRLNAVSTGVGAAATAGYFGMNHWNWKWDAGVAGISQVGASVLTTVGCAALSPIVATAVLKRPLTQREAGILVGSCVIPIIGGWLVNQLYNAHPDWNPAYKAAHAGHVRYRHARDRHVRHRR